MKKFIGNDKFFIDVKIINVKSSTNIKIIQYRFNIKRLKRIIKIEATIKQIYFLKNFKTFKWFLKNYLKLLSPINVVQHFFQL